MPELPEVETLRRGIGPHIQGRTITDLIVRNPQLRWSVPAHLAQTLAGQPILSVHRRAKYLLIETPRGTLILHLGMSGSLRILPVTSPPTKHDHVDFLLNNGQCLRLRDPRRFGAVLWTEQDPLTHPLLSHLGPEPLSEAFDGKYLYQQSRGRKLAVKSFIMDGKIVAGIGNIYANEALFFARIRPTRLAGRISLSRYVQLTANIKAILEQAIRLGGTTLRDFFSSDGRPGYFRLQLAVYDRTGQCCIACGGSIRRLTLGQRSTYYCPHCQH